MPAKPIDAFSNEIPHLKKQIGCMAGIFQIFDRHHLLSRHGRKRLHSDHAPGNSRRNAAAHNGLPPQVTLEKNLSRSLTERSSLSMESSRASSSSSSCSSFSSLDCQKSIQLELPSINDPVKNPTRSGQQQACFRDVVKHSINRDLSVKTSVKEEMKKKELKHRDSPRPLLISKSMDGTYVIGIDKTTRTATDVSEKLKEAPFKFPEYEARRERSRLSFDDREFPCRSAGSRDNSKPATKLKELPRLSLDSRKVYLRNSSTNEESPSLKRASSIIAKLMGVEALPNSGTAEGHDASGVDDQLPCSPSSIQKDPNHSLAAKTKSSSRNVTVTAPWRQQPNAASVCTEIGKRLKESEFQEFNKDLRALKQILNAMHSKEPLESKRSDRQCSISSVYETFSNQSPTRRDKNLRLAMAQSQIVVMKSEKSLGKLGAPAATGPPIVVLKSLQKLQTNCSQDKSKCSVVSIKVKQQSPRTSSSKDKRSPGLLQRKVEIENKSLLTIPSESNKARRQSKGESVSPRNRLPSGTSQVKSSELKILSHQQDEAMASETDVKAKQSVFTAIDHHSIQSPSSRAVHDSAYILNSKESSLKPNENTPDKEIGSAAHENILSPVSVLDASFYEDDLSPVKKISHELKEGEIHTLEESWNPVGLLNNPPSKASSMDNPMKVENIRTLLQKLQQLSSAENELPSSERSVSSIGKNTDHQYIYDILSASGLLVEDLSFRQPFPSQLQQPTYPINPDLFLDLKHTKLDRVSTTESKPRSEKLHRKLVFDAANEIIAHKMELAGSMLQTKKLSGQRLLKDLCAEVDQLQTESSKTISHEHNLDNLMMCQMKGWESFGHEVQGVVLDIERSLFKDLIDEVISGETAVSGQVKRWRLRRQLFGECMN